MMRSVFVNEVAMGNRILFSAFVLLSLMVESRLVVSAEPVASIPAAPSETTSKLIRELGNDDFQVRERATAELTMLGFRATNALQEAVKSTDREVRYRAQRILTNIERLDFEQRLEAFLNNKADDSGLHLPSWERFRKSYGETRPAKLLFVEMVKSEAHLLQAIQNNPKTAAETHLNRVMALQQAQQMFPQEVQLGSIAAVLFAAAEPDIPVQTQATHMVYSFCHQATFRNAITAGENKDLLRSMLGGWVRRVDEANAYLPLMVAMNYDLKDALVAAERVLKGPQGNSHARQYAVLAVGKYGNAEHRKLLTPLLEDKTVCHTWQMNNVNIQVQVRDVALAILIHMHDKDPKQFGFERIQKGSPYLYAVHTMGFENDQKRSATVKKWNDHLAEEKPTKESKTEKPQNG